MTSLLFIYYFESLVTENASRTPAAGLNGSLKIMSELGTDLRTQTYQVTENASRTPAAGLKGSPLIMSVLGTKLKPVLNL